MADYVWLGLTVFVAVLAALFIDTVIDRTWRWTRAENDDDDDDRRYRERAGGVGFVMPQLSEDDE